MSRSGKILFFVGLLAILAAYALLYTPLYDVLFAPKAPAPAIKAPAPPIQGLPKIILKEEPEEKPKPEALAKEEKSKEKKDEKKELVPAYTVLRDPFILDFAYEKVEKKEGGEPVQVVTYLQLQGIFITGSTKMAIIDDNVVGEGDRIALGWRVSRIYSDRVVITKGRSSRTLRIKLGVE